VISWEPYYTSAIFLISGAGMILFGILGIIVVGINNGISEAGRPFAVAAAGVVGLCLPFVFAFGAGAMVGAGNTARAQKAIAIL